MDENSNNQSLKGSLQHQQIQNAQERQDSVSPVSMDSNHYSEANGEHAAKSEFSLEDFFLFLGGQ